MFQLKSLSTSIVTIVSTSSNTSWYQISTLKPGRVSLQGKYVGTNDVRLTKPLTTTRDVNVFEPIAVTPATMTVPFGPGALPFNVNYTVSNRLSLLARGPRVFTPL